MAVFKEAAHRDELRVEKWDLIPFADAGRLLSEAVKNKLSTTDIVNIIFSAATALKASDVHFEPEKGDALLRLRLDGLLYDVIRLPHDIYNDILGRIKLIAGLKLNVVDVPQDGRFTIIRDGDEIEVRASTVPSEYGETAVLRLLDPKAVALNLEDLGLRSDDMDIAAKELKKPNGMVLVTGPTGSGKTTTLYAFLKKVHNPGLKTITIEDPIEYHLAGIEQTQVDPKAGYDFASGLRSILRQDPDIILVGEIRDLETAEVAMHAALTGHLVFSTLHTNDAAGAVPRLIDMGIKPAIIGPALNLIVAQRLVRRLCENCKIEMPISQELAENISKFIAKLPKRVETTNIKPKIYSAKGCDKCHGGYRGRVGIFELLLVDDALENLIAQGATEETIREFARQQEMVGMQADGIIKALSGMTTLDEIERATGPIEWSRL
jgi:type II secretory ATPase GspE/PulE/Tfp pilus assembly ATPase PilB-like protein